VKKVICTSSLDLDVFPHGRDLEAQKGGGRRDFDGERARDSDGKRDSIGSGRKERG
jgi:hypothetical protein